MLNDTDRAWLEEVEARSGQVVKAFISGGDVMELAAKYCTDIPRLIAMVRAGEVHAEWIMQIYEIDGEWHTARVCSNCEQNRVAGICATYCPNCGAIMDGQRAGEGARNE